jgi:hypothetical protein
MSHAWGLVAAAPWSAFPTVSWRAPSRPSTPRAPGSGLGGPGIARDLPATPPRHGRSSRYLLVVADHDLGPALEGAVRRRHQELASLVVHVLARRQRSWLWLAASAACPFTGYLPYDSSCDAMWRDRDRDGVAAGVSSGIRRLHDAGITVTGSPTAGDPLRAVTAWTSHTAVVEVLVAPAGDPVGRWRRRRLLRRLRRRVAVPVRAVD